MVPLEEEDLGEPPCSPLEGPVTREGDWELWPPIRVREGERRKTTVGGLNTSGHAPNQTLSGLTGHCLGETDFIWPCQTLFGQDSLSTEKNSRLETWMNLNFSDCNGTKHLYIV
jgi:hypothetical protein